MLWEMDFILLSNSHSCVDWVVLGYSFLHLLTHSYGICPPDEVLQVFTWSMLSIAPVSLEYPPNLPQNCPMCRFPLPKMTSQTAQTPSFSPSHSQTSSVLEYFADFQQEWVFWSFPLEIPQQFLNEQRWQNSWYLPPFYHTTAYNFQSKDSSKYRFHW